MKRSGKFYRNNEKEIMLQLGLKPTFNSGSGEIEKEDGQNEKVICQLKSTDKQSITVKKYDVETLLYNASVSHKIPVFALNFLEDNSVYLLVRPQDLKDIVHYLNTGEIKENNDLNYFDDVEENTKNKTTKRIKSNSKYREKFSEEIKNKYKKGKSAL